MAPLVLFGSNIAWGYLRGGSAWTQLSWILGLQRMGVEVFVVDQLDSAHCVFAAGAEPAYDNALNIAWFDAIIGRFGLSGRAALIGEAGQSLRGPNRENLCELATSADALVNLAGALRVGAIKDRVRRRILVDTDPGLTHLWMAAGRRIPRVLNHHLHFTVGENVGRPECTVPTAGMRWRHVRQPVLLDQWPVCDTEPTWRFTTVAKWRGAGPHGRLADAGVTVTDKADEFLRFADVARLSGQRFEVALDGAANQAETERLARAGWVVADAGVVAADPESFRRYVQGSGAEFSVAKGVYVQTRSGWFSDRTTRYLASGKPALVQDTGFARSIPVGEGLITFQTVHEAAAAARRIAADYAGHAAAARRLAEEHFAAEVVLAPFLDEALGAAI